MTFPVHACIPVTSGEGATNIRTLPCRCLIWDSGESWTCFYLLHNFLSLCKEFLRYSLKIVMDWLFILFCNQAKQDLVRFAVISLVLEEQNLEQKTSFPSDCRFLLKCKLFLLSNQTVFLFCFKVSLIFVKSISIIWFLSF